MAWRQDNALARTRGRRCAIQRAAQSRRVLSDRRQHAFDQPAVTPPPAGNGRR
jgi:hypothetical protein